VNIENINFLFTPCYFSNSFNDRPKQPVIGIWSYFNTNMLFAEILLEFVEGLILRIEMSGCFKAKCV